MSMGSGGPGWRRCAVRGSRPGRPALQHRRAHRRSPLLSCGGGDFIRLYTNGPYRTYGHRERPLTAARLCLAVDRATHARQHATWWRARAPTSLDRLPLRVEGGPAQIDADWLVLVGRGVTDQVVADVARGPRISPSLRGGGELGSRCSTPFERFRPLLVAFCRVAGAAEAFPRSSASSSPSHYHALATRSRGGLDGVPRSRPRG